jgi:hypothetical protein
MRRGLVWTLGVLFVLGASLPAAAGSSSGGGEVIGITKAIYICVKQTKQIDRSAEAAAVKRDWSQGNTVFEQTEIIPDNDGFENSDNCKTVLPVALIHESVFNEFKGIVTLNQSPGDINTQGNAVSTAFANCSESFLHAKACAEKVLGERWDSQKECFIGEGNCVEAPYTPRSNLITDCLLGVHGIIGINQSAGNINNQNNAVAMAVGDKATACIAESELSLISGGNTVKELAVIKTDVLEGAVFTGCSSGIVAINQATGNICNQANVVSSCLLAPF